MVQPINTKKGSLIFYDLESAKVTVMQKRSELDYQMSKDECIERFKNTLIDLIFEDMARQMDRITPETDINVLTRELESIEDFSRRMEITLIYF